MAFQILKRFAKTPVPLISHETGRLPPDMGTNARFISGRSGGPGEVITALCEGLTEGASNSIRPIQIRNFAKLIRNFRIPPSL